MAAHRLPGVTVVADAGMISEANQKAIEAACRSSSDEDPRRPLPGGQVAQGALPGRRSLTGTCSSSPGPQRRDQTICYQFRADRARRTLRGIVEHVAKAAKAVAGLAMVNRNRFIRLDGAAKSINRELEARARNLAGPKGYEPTSAPGPTAPPSRPSS
jgi:hypothetical protein